MDALGEEVELLDAVNHDDELSIDHHPLARQGPQLLDDLREVAVHPPSAAALEVDVVAVAEDDGAKAVPLRLVAPALSLGQLLRRARELGRDRGCEGEVERQGGHPSAGRPRQVASRLRAA